MMGGPETPPTSTGPRYRKGDRVRLTDRGLASFRDQVRSGRGATVVSTPRDPERIGIAIRLDGRRDLFYALPRSIEPEPASPIDVGPSPD